MDWNQDLIPPLDPNTSYVEIEGSLGYMSVARVGPTCTYVSFAQGCAGSMPPSRLVPRDTPRIGKIHEVTLFDLPHSLAVLVFGFQRLATPVPLAFAGMPGCDLHTTIDVTFPLAGANNQAKWFLAIPDDPTLVGFHFYNQALVFDANAGNPLGAVMSNAAEGVIGHW